MSEYYTIVWNRVISNFRIFTEFCKINFSISFNFPKLWAYLQLSELFHFSYQVQRYVCEPVNGGDDVGEEDELGLVVGARKLPGLEGVHGRAQDQHERVGEAGHDAETI